MAVTRGDDGRLVLVKQAGPGEAAERLRREARALTLAAAAWCVELVEVAAEPDGGVRLVTAWVGGGTLATGGLGPERLAGVARALAAAVAALHARDLAHGRLTPDHVLLDGDRPVLCGFGSCRLPDEGQGPSADDDVRALLALITGAVGDRRGGVADRLRAVAAAGTGGGAAAVADRLATAAPDRPAPASEPRPRPRPRTRPLRRRPAPRRPPVRAVLATGALALVLLALAVGVWQDGPGPAPPRRPAATTAPACPPTTAPAADLDGDGCREAVRVRGAVVASGDRRWAVGDEGDVAAVGDWDCDGRSTAAVVRPPTGEVWVYDGWASAGRTVVAHPGPAAPGAVGARAVTGPGGCDRLEVTTADGGRRVLALA